MEKVQRFRASRGSVFANSHFGNGSLQSFKNISMHIHIGLISTSSVQTCLEQNYNMYGMFIDNQEFAM